MKDFDLKSYRAPWNGKLILACSKCQKKLKKSGLLRDLAKLKKTVKHHNKAFPDGQLSVINISCMKLCPKNGVTVCLPAQDPTRLLIIRNADELHRLSNGKSVEEDRSNSVDGYVAD